HPVEGIVDLDGHKALGVVAQHLAGRKFLRIERPQPFLVRVPACSRQQLHRFFSGLNPTLAITAGVSETAAAAMSRHGSAFTLLSRFGMFPTLKRSKRRSADSSSHATGADTGAFARARVEYAATAVAPSPLRR